MSEENKKSQPPAIGPYFFPTLLFFFGLWCVYDGWFTTDPEMLRYKTFNQIMSVVFLGWSTYDVLHTRRMMQKLKSKSSQAPEVKK